jgi:hypothetical protein
MASSKRFHGKFTGAKARLFAQTCENYSCAVEEAYNSTNDEHPIFSWLSPQQRLQLVHEVMVGLLCPDEPLPPETIQHYTTYLALVANIVIEIEVEIHTVYDDEVADDLLDGYDDTPAVDYADGDKADEDTADDDISDDDATDDDRIQTPEERKRNRDLICRQAEKNKEKINRTLAGTDTSPVEEFQAPASNRLDAARKLSSFTLALFAGPPISAEERRVHRPLTDTEKYSFLWRLMADEALQENTNSIIPFPLCDIDFDWKCQSSKKWASAIHLLLITSHSADITLTEQALVDGEIGEVDYADTSRHARIYAIEKIVKDLRDSYDPVWKADMLALDQRAIFAVCSSETYISQERVAWVTAFMASCREQGVDFSAGGDYQKRLEIYRRMAPLYTEGLLVSFHGGFDHFEDARTPSDFQREEPIHHVMCHVDSCIPSASKDALKLCARCKVVSYCSRECQANDWPDHKKHCKILAELRKDKAKVSAIARNFEEGSSGNRLHDYF